MGKNREKQFAKNTMILTLGTLSSKLFTFFLLPLYTSVLTTQDYGNVDVLQSIIQLALPIVTLQLSASLFRFLIDNNTFKDISEIVTSALALILGNCIVFLLLAEVFNLIWGVQYFGCFIFSFIGCLCYLIMQNIARGFGHNILYSVASFLTVFVSLILNIILILGFNIKGSSILISLGSSNFCAALVIFFKEKIWKYFNIKAFSTTRLKELLKYSAPLIPNELSWWIANSSDRFLILFFLGSSFNGIYAAANKIPNIFTVIYGIFNIAWLESVSRNINDSDSQEFINSMIEKFLKFFGCLCIGIISCITVFFDFLVGNDFRSAYPHVFILTIAVFINCICAMFGGIYGAHKDSKTIGSTTVYGAITNIIINLCLINAIGLYAASLSTLLSYFVVLIIRFVRLKKYLIIRIRKDYFFRFAIALVVSGIVYFYENKSLGIIVLISNGIWAFMENKQILIGIMRTAIQKIHK